MQTQAYITNSVSIAAPIATVWAALTQPEFTRQYMFGCAPITNWALGGTIDWEGTYEDVTAVFVKGNIVAIEALNKLHYTVFDPMSTTMPDIPANYLTVTYDLGEADGITTLHLTQGDYTKVANGDARYAAGYNDGLGWQPILDQIKAICEEE